MPHFEANVDALLASFHDRLGFNDAGGRGLPDRESVVRICDRFLSLCFPGFFASGRITATQLPAVVRRLLAEQECDLVEQVHRARCFASRCRGTEPPTDLEQTVTVEVAEVLAEIGAVRGLLATDIEAAFDNDPAATSREEVIVAYPFLETIAVQRLAHRLYRRGVPFLPRMMTEVAHARTGIDIHPGAEIGEYFFIDHGTGVVIGETCRIGHHVTLYHGVTLGAFNPLVKNAAGELQRGQSNKRHPDLEDHVTVYSGAAILGDVTMGHHSVIGGNVWLTHSVAPYSRVSIRDPDLLIRQKQHQAPDFTI